MKCQNCGANIADGSLFCENCGSRLNAQPENTEAPVVVSEEKPRKKKGGFFVWLFVFLVQLALIGGGLYGLNYQIRRACSAERAAEKFFVAAASGDVHKAYSMLDIEEDGFFNEKTFEAYVKSELNGTVAKYRVGSEDDDRVEIKYWLEGKDNKGKKKELTIELRKQNKKKWFFFNEWKIDPDEFIADDYTVSVPIYATLQIDGQDVPNSYEEEENKDKNIFSASDDKNEYVIPKLFKGKHTLTAKAEGYADKTQSVEIVGDQDYDYIDELPLSMETDEMLRKKAVEVVEVYLDALVNYDENSKTALEPYLTKAYSKEYFSDWYDKALKDYGGKYEKMEVLKISVENSYFSGMYDIEFSVKIPKKDGTMGVHVNDQFTSIEFVNEDGEWKVDSIHGLEWLSLWEW